MNEPLIIGFGRSHVNEYPVEEFHASLVRAFRTHRADFIVLDSNMASQKFRAACVAWAIDNGYLYHDESDGDAQGEVYSFRLTERGKKKIRTW